MSRFYGVMETVGASTSKEALPNIGVDVEQSFQEVNKFEKTMTLIKLVQENDGRGILVFVSTKRTADFVADVISEQLQKPTASLHEDRKRRHRKLALQSFVNGDLDILVATTGAMCGADIVDVHIVVNYDLPTSMDEYVDRIGRVGYRGKIISYFDVNQDKDIVADLAKYLWKAGQPIPDFFQGENIPKYYRFSAPNLQLVGGCSVWLPYCCECSNYGKIRSQRATGTNATRHRARRLIRAAQSIF